MDSDIPSTCSTPIISNTKSILSGVDAPERKRRMD
jgi:hypothetical protein